MLCLSLGFHLLIFSFVFLVPHQVAVRKIAGDFYEVTLVEMTNGKPSPKITGRPSEKSRAISSTKLAASTKLLPATKIKPQKVVIAKRTVTTKTDRVKEPPLPSAGLIEEALSKIERKAKEEKKDDSGQVKPKAPDRTESPSRGEGTGSGSSNGIEIRWYQIEVESRIKSNWSFPVALAEPKGRSDLEAIVLVKVKNNGSIIETRFKKRSPNAVFDQSVLKAIERSDPLPPFPEGYRKTYDQIEINFNLRDLEL